MASIPTISCRASRTWWRYALLAGVVFHLVTWNSQSVSRVSFSGTRYGYERNPLQPSTVSFSLPWPQPPMHAHLYAETSTNCSSLGLMREKDKEEEVEELLYDLPREGERERERERERDYGQVR
ncbi:hypothetical protein GOP47_0027893 [Adiantum capillus-veneris]|nr:hypothetical protein GOP47_0027893 [Adiantum capillus-veneris]